MSVVTDVEPALYDIDEVATTAALNAAPVGTVLVTYLGEGWAFVKIGSSSWAHPVNGVSVSKKRPGHWFALKAPVIIWEPPEGCINPGFDEHFFGESEVAQMYAGRRLSQLIADAADTFHIPLDVRTRIVAAIIAGDVQP